MRSSVLTLAVCGFATSAVAEDLPFTTDMPALARAVIAADRGGSVDARFRAQLVAGDIVGARASLHELLDGRAHDPSPRVRARDQQYAIYTREASSIDIGFRAVIAGLDGPASALVVNGLSFDNLAQAKTTYDADIARQHGNSTIALADAIQLVRDYNDVRVYTALKPRVASLVEAYDASHYVVTKDVSVRTADGATVCASIIVRPRATGRRPALLMFTIYNDAGQLMREARRAASNDYAGVMGLVRGKGCSSGPIEPYEHDGADAAALVDWIAAQPWSDGKVGMYGGSYSGFTPWAAAKYRPRALVAIMVGAPVMPGIDAPMEGNVFWNFIYPWPFYTTTSKTLDEATYGDRARWSRLDHDYYTSGRAYRDLDKLDTTPNPIFDRWLAHPAYDDYWQRMLPNHDELAHLDIPVLLTAGYYFGGPGAATVYFSRYQAAAPAAPAYLVIGPYDHFTAQRGPDGNVLSGYTLDPAALVDFTELRYRWFDYALRGAPKPPLLGDHVNYEVPGANTWKHAPTLDAVARTTTTFYLDAKHHLATAATSGSSAQVVDFADRRDVDVQTPGGNVLDTAVDTTNGIAFTSDPIPQATELSGMFSARLDVISNKVDFDFQVSLYELTKDGHYIQLAPYWSRASYVADLSRRHLLVVDKPQTLAFHAIRMMSRAVAAGSRLVAVVSVIKESGREINYGTGKTVEDETIADAKTPLKLQWLATSSITVPVGH